MRDGCIELLATEGTAGGLEIPLIAIGMAPAIWIAAAHNLILSAEIVPETVDSCRCGKGSKSDRDTL